MAKTSAETLQIDRKIWDLKLAGGTTAQIAAALDLTPAQLAKKMERVKKLIQPEIKDAALSHVALNYARAERLIRAIFQRATGTPAQPGVPAVAADLDAMDRMIKLMAYEDSLIVKSMGGGKLLPAPPGDADSGPAAAEEADADAARSELLRRITRVIDARGAVAGTEGS